ncbi:MAG: GDSL-type esterase/lipase family protein, partial [Mariprofundus sp.]|nr:GDSL-type esterase/lipase family protein [Mariprofundus sp.]
PATQLPKLSPDAVILAFGDSLTYGTGVEAEQSYPSILSSLTGHTVINAGIPGEESDLGLARLPKLLDETQPELIIICHGANDILRRKSLRQAELNVRAMVNIAQQRGVAVIILAVPEFGILLSPADFYLNIAEQMHIPIEDKIISHIVADHAMKSDRVHPNSKGYQLIAEAIYALMRKSGAI